MKAEVYSMKRSNFYEGSAGVCCWTKGEGSDRLSGRVKRVSACVSI